MAGTNSENAEKTRAEAERLFPNETWVDPKDVKFKHTGKDYEIPPDLRNIKVSRSKIQEVGEKTLAKEIRQAHILAQRGDSVYLVPNKKDDNGGLASGYDAIINGQPYEFKTVTGNINAVRKNFWESRKQSDNVYMRIADRNITIDDVRRVVHGVLVNPKYTGTAKGWLIVTFDGTGKTHRLSIGSLK